jgi:hypothetical protein
MDGMTIMNLTTTKGCDFAFHIEEGKVVIDKCEGLDPASALEMFSFEIELLREAEERDSDV